jgi:3-deoxy-D-manno-octulosonic-acid transferase
MRLRRPGSRFLLSVTTSTAHAIAARQIGGDTRLVYFALDFPWMVRRAYSRIRPCALILVECELWPNWIRRMTSESLPVFLVNARLSDRSFRRYRLVRGLSRRLLPKLRGLYAQTAEDRARFLELGVPADRIETPGCAKYDLEPRDPEREAAAAVWIRRVARRPDALVLAGGSTWPGEEDLLLDLFVSLRRTRPELVLLLAPRHAERCGEVEQALRSHGLIGVRRSVREEIPLPADASVLLLDTTGELRHMYAAADLVFIGKSLTAHGGQNPLEPAQCGKAILCGPNMENFRAIVEDLRAADALIQLRGPEDLFDVVDCLLADESRRSGLGRNAADRVAALAGALARTVDGILPHLPPVG